MAGLSPPRLGRLLGDLLAAPPPKPRREAGEGQSGAARGLLEPTPLPPGVHLEGPFISREKRGAHPEDHLRSFEARAFQDVLATYGPLDNVCMVTLAPELSRSPEVIRALTARGIRVSLGEGRQGQAWGAPGVRGLSPMPPPPAGHSVADLRAAEEAVQSGATFITHLFNAMLPVRGGAAGGDASE